MEAEVIVPGGPPQLAADAALALVLAEQGGGYPTQQTEVLRCCAVLEPTVVLPEDHVQHPVQTVLDAPVSPGGAAQLLRAAPAATDVMGDREGFLAAFPV